jgi:hypothetical protein
MNVILDISPPRLGKLTIEGGLRFDNSSANANLTLQVASIVVFGKFEIGSASQPFLGNATVVVFGVRSSPTVVVDNAYFLGNKLIAVYGTFSVYGIPRNVTWARLATTAAAGSNVLTVASEVDWRVGEEVVITATDYDSSQIETAFVTSVSVGGGQSIVALNRTLRNSHLCSSVPVTGWLGTNASSDQSGAYGSGGGNGVVPLCGVVGLLSRNVRFMSAEVNASTVNYGAHMTVGETVRTPAFGGGRTIGQLNLHFAQLLNFGKMGMEQSSMRFQYTQNTNPVNVINGSAFAYSLNYALVAVNTKQLLLTNNVFHQSYRSTIDLDVTVRGSCGYLVCTAIACVDMRRSSMPCLFLVLL